MPSIVWQVDEPGTHTVTLTKGWLKALFVGPPLTTTGTALPVEFESHCLDDTCAIRSNAPMIARARHRLPDYRNADAGQRSCRRTRCR
jgi:hypothetical protein